MYTIEFTDSELELLYDALNELGYSVEDETEANSISSMLHRIYLAKQNKWELK